LVEKQQINETKIAPPKPRKNNNQQLKQRKKQLLDAIGRDAYGGVNVFEGTTPAPAATNEGQARGPLADVSPNDPGVDISGLFGDKAFAMSQRLMEKK
jgi:flagellin-like hook-associated protein FlgL